MDKKTKIGIGIAAVVVLAAVVGVFVKIGQGQSIPFETVEWQDFYSGMEKKENVVVRGDSDWQSLWARAHANTLPAPEAPQVNFGESMIIGTFMGEQSTGGYQTNIDKIVEKQDSLEVYVKESSPGENCFVTESFTRPYHIVKAPASGKTVNFITEEVKTDCK